MSTINIDSPNLSAILSEPQTFSSWPMRGSHLIPDSSATAMDGLTIKSPQVPSNFESSGPARVFSNWCVGKEVYPKYGYLHSPPPFDSCPNFPKNTVEPFPRCPQQQMLMMCKRGPTLSLSINYSTSPSLRHSSPPPSSQPFYRSFEDSLYSSHMFGPRPIGSYKISCSSGQTHSENSFGIGVVPAGHCGPPEQLSPPTNSSLNGDFWFQQQQPLFQPPPHMGSNFSMSANEACDQPSQLLDCQPSRNYEINCSSGQMYSRNGFGIDVPAGNCGTPDQLSSPIYSFPVEVYRHQQQPAFPSTPLRMENVYSMADTKTLCDSPELGWYFASHQSPHVEPPNYFNGWMVKQRAEVTTTELEVSTAEANEMTMSSRDEPMPDASSFGCTDAPKGTPINGNTKTRMKNGKYQAKELPRPKRSCFWHRSSYSATSKNEKKYCLFCKQNRETKEFYKSHTLKDETGGITCCPILRKYKCPLCHATGDDAHTLRHCPENTGSFLNGRPRGKSLSNLKSSRKVVGAD